MCDGVFTRAHRASPFRGVPALSIEAKSGPAIQLLPRGRAGIDKELHVIRGYQRPVCYKCANPKRAKHRLIGEPQRELLGRRKATVGKRNRLAPGDKVVVDGRPVEAEAHVAAQCPLQDDAFFAHAGKVGRKNRNLHFFARGATTNWRRVNGKHVPIVYD